MRLFKKSDIVPDMNFAAEGMTVKYGTFQPEWDNQIIINPDSKPRVCRVEYGGKIVCVASGKRVEMTNDTTWRYYGKYKPYKQDYSY